MFFLDQGTDFLGVVHHMYNSSGSDSEDEERERKKQEQLRKLHLQLQLSPAAISCFVCVCMCVCDCVCVCMKGLNWLLLERKRERDWKCWRRKLCLSPVSGMPTQC